MEKKIEMLPKIEDIYKKAETYFKEGFYKESVQSFTECITLQKTIEYKTDTPLGLSYLGLGEALFKLGEYRDGLSNVNTALKLFENDPLKNQLHISKSYLVIGDIEKDSGNYKQSMEALNKSLDIYKNLNGEEDINTAKNENLIGEVYYYQKKYKEAFKIFERSLQKLTKFLGTEDDEYVARIYNNLGATASEIDPNLNKSLVPKYYNRSIEIKIKVLGESHPDVALAYYNLGYVFHRNGQLQQAIQYMENSIKIHNDRGRIHHPLLALCHNELGNLFFKQKKPCLGMKHLQYAVRIKLQSPEVDVHGFYCALLNIAYKTEMVQLPLSLVYMRKKNLFQRIKTPTEHSHQEIYDEYEWMLQKNCIYTNYETL